jgi:diguanylate cyclase (GGDEF)-like protein
MNVANAISINVFSLIILAFIFANTYNRAEHSLVQHRMFTALLCNLALLLVFDSLTYFFDGRPGELNRHLNCTFTALMYLFVPVLLSLWVLYTDYQIFHDEKRFRRLAWPLIVYMTMDAAMIVASIFTGWYFSFDSMNLYHRGPFLAIHTISCYIFLLYTLIFIIANRKRMDRNHFISLLLFAAPGALGALMQCFVLGMSLTWSSMTLSILMIYVNIQDKRLNTDYLTGAYNRRLLDSYVEDKVKSTARGKTFSAILIDLDDFKLINDNFGHDAGDEALLAAVSLLKSCLRHGDLISRYGGDEFLIILDIGTRAVLEETVQRLRHSFERFNQSSAKPYVLKFSTGYDVYSLESGMDPERFIKHVDTLMYENKKQSNAAGEGQWR